MPPANVATTNQGDSPQELYNALPIVTKVLLTLTFGMTFLVSFNLLPFHYLIYSMEIVWARFEIWRIVTGCLFVGGFSFNFLIHMYMLYQISMAYESNAYNTGMGGTSADYAWMVILGMLSICLLDPIFHIAPQSDAFLYFLMYVRSRRAPNDIMNMWGFKFKALYMPWVYIAFRMLMGGSIKSAMAGAVLGHLFYFLVEVLPYSYEIDLIRTPQIVGDMVAYASGRSQPAPVQSSRSTGGGRAATAGGTTGYNWGRGHRLGT